MGNVNTFIYRQIGLYGNFKFFYFARSKYSAESFSLPILRPIVAVQLYVLNENILVTIEDGYFYFTD